jgi:hypothetical protein
LRKVASPEAPSEAYSETSHSRDVEERERQQGWSDGVDEDDDNETKRMRVLKETLEATMTGSGNGRILSV